MSSDHEIGKVSSEQTQDINRLVMDDIFSGKPSAVSPPSLKLLLQQTGNSDRALQLDKYHPILNWPSQEKNPCADRVHFVGKLDEKTGLPEQVFIDQAGKAPMIFQRVSGQEFVDTNGKKYRITVDFPENGTLNAAALDGKTDYTWLKTGKQIKVSTDEKGISCRRVDSAAGEKEAEIKTDKNKNIINLEIRQADGSFLSLRNGHGLHSGSLYHQDGSGPPHRATLKDGVLTLHRLNQWGTPAETTTVYPAGDSKVERNDAEGVPIFASGARVNGKYYSHHADDGHWVDAETGKQVELCFKKNHIEVKSKQEQQR